MSDNRENVQKIKFYEVRMQEITIIRPSLGLGRLINPLTADIQIKGRIGIQMKKEKIPKAQHSGFVL